MMFLSSILCTLRAAFDVILMTTNNVTMSMQLATSSAYCLSQVRLSNASLRAINDEVRWTPVRSICLCHEDHVDCAVVGIFEVGNCSAHV